MGIVISTHLPPPVMIDSTEVLKWVTHMLCWTWAMCFSAAASSENDQGSMNLASNTAPLSPTMPSRVAPIHRFTGWRIRRCTSVTTCPVLRSYQSRFRSSVTRPSWTIRLSERSSGSTSPRFSRHRRWRAASSSPMMIRASEPPMNPFRSDALSFVWYRDAGIEIGMTPSSTAYLVLLAHVTMAQYNGCDKCTSSNGPCSPKLDSSGSRRGLRASSQYDYQHRDWTLRRRPEIAGFDRDSSEEGRR